MMAGIRRKFFIAIISICVIDFTALLFLPGRWLYGSFLVKAPPPVQAEVILVLYCGPDRDGALDRRTTRRVLYGSELVRKGVAPVILCSGGFRPTRGFHGAEKMAALAVEAGVPADRVFTECGSRDSVGNLRESRKIMRQRGWRSAVLVASAFQIRRLRSSIGEGEEDFRYAPVPYDYPPMLTRLEMWCYAQYSLLADMAYRILPARALENLAGWLRK